MNPLLSLGSVRLGSMHHDTVFLALHLCPVDNTHGENEKLAENSTFPSENWMLPQNPHDTPPLH